MRARPWAAETLAGAAIVALFTIGETPWSRDQRAALLRQVRSGTTSVLAIHSATDACHGWDEYGRAWSERVFAGHPWTLMFTLEVHRPDHPALAHLGPTWSWHDEVYLFSELRPDAEVPPTVRPDELGPEEHVRAPDVPGPALADGGYPLAWCFTEGEGRVFSTSLGHFPHAWESTDYLAEYPSGGLRGSARPSACSVRVETTGWPGAGNGAADEIDRVPRTPARWPCGEARRDLRATRQPPTRSYGTAPRRPRPRPRSDRYQSIPTAGGRHRTPRTGDPRLELRQLCAAHAGSSPLSLKGQAELSDGGMTARTAGSIAVRVSRDMPTSRAV